MHGPDIVLLDVALSIALGGDCLQMWAYCGPSRPYSARWLPSRWRRDAPAPRRHPLGSRHPTAPSGSGWAPFSLVSLHTALNGRCPALTMIGLRLLMETGVI
ncbi:hypothetical protein GCM10011583_70550 [Streptomyces camponoticapitis]|uniref:Uncharacterized protein n=1 Tax=Streptomyces camponoticapitis TaxID=1616125 RepID=A0ABQ2EZI5_9ACTN|nr:hypothetical protein GCM10011583_70550 [Streptomyces camponoticapitis]